MNKSITKQAQQDSYAAILESLSTRQRNVLDVLSAGREMTAQEIAIALHAQGLTRSDDRNNASPRLTELRDLEIVEPLGRRACSNTGRKVTVWVIKKDFDAFLKSQH